MCLGPRTRDLVRLRLRDVLGLRARDLKRGLGFNTKIPAVSGHAGCAAVLLHRFVNEGIVTQLVKFHVTILKNANLLSFIHYK